jgi:hypothetical protein
MYMWHTPFTSSGFDRGTAVRQTTDGGFIIGAIGNRNDGGTFGDFYQLKLDQMGQKVWAISYPQTAFGTNTGWLEEIIQVADGGYLLSGSIKNFNSGQMTAILIKTDRDGTKLWQKILSGTGAFNYLLSMQYVPKDCGYIFGGKYGAASGKQNFDFMVIKTDGDGHIQ